MQKAFGLAKLLGGFRKGLPGSWRNELFAGAMAESANNGAIQASAPLAYERLFVQLPGMDDDDWWAWPDRREMFDACLALADSSASAERVSEAANTLLNDLELYDDPRQGHDDWLFDDEIDFADNLAAKLYAVVGGAPAEGGGGAITAHLLWEDIRSDAQQLLSAIRRNGRGSARR